MTFNGSEIRKLRQRLGWSLAEMARRLGSSTNQLADWELDASQPDNETINQLRYLLQYVESNSEQVAQTPILEREIETRGVAQLTHRDLLKDSP